MTTLLVLGFGAVAMMALAGLALAWAAFRVVLWIVFLPLMLLKAVFGLVFGMVFGTIGLVIGLVVSVVLAGLGLLALLAVVAVPLLPLLLLAGLVWLAIKGTTALATA